MPRVTDWRGLGSTPPAARAWEKIKKQFEFAEALAKLRPQVCGAGNLERFDYWLNSSRAMESIAHLEQRIRRSRQRLDLYYTDIAAALGAPAACRGLALRAFLRRVTHHCHDSANAHRTGRITEN
jgi:hypothetical protein